LLLTGRLAWILDVLRARMIASRLNHRERVIPAQTDHLEDKSGVIGLQSSHEQADPVCQASDTTAGAFGLLGGTVNLRLTRAAGSGAVAAALVVKGWSGVCALGRCAHLEGVR